jgi:hypothetical protein
MPNYPTSEQLRKIEAWKEDYKGLMEFIRPIWEFNDCGYFRNRGSRYWLDTAGWSGNEDIIVALKKNIMFWMFCWQQSRRGGHYIFQIPKSNR